MTIFGPHPEDRERERELDRYLSSLSAEEELVECSFCNKKAYEEDMHKCPECGALICDDCTALYLLVGLCEDCYDELRKRYPDEYADKKEIK